MFLPFENMPPDSRIWIYQTNKPLSEESLHFASQFLIKYCNEWVAHGQPLKASFHFEFNHFIILAVDETYNPTSGCSMDDSVRAIKHISSVTGADFFNRELVAFKKETVFLVGVKELKQKLQDGIWDQTTLMFNNLISTKDQLTSQWIVPAGETWLRRYSPGEYIKT